MDTDDIVLLLWRAIYVTEGRWTTQILLWYTDSGLEPSQVCSLRHKSQWLQGAPKLATLTAFSVVTLSQNVSKPWWPSAVGGQPCFVIWATSSFS